MCVCVYVYVYVYIRCMYQLNNKGILAEVIAAFEQHMNRGSAMVCVKKYES